MRKELRNNMKKALQEVFPVELKRYRVQHGMTQEAMARGLMVSTRSYIDQEHGGCMPCATTLALFLLLLSKEEQRRLLGLLRAGIEKAV